jgi:hypothetical protein
MTKSAQPASAMALRQTAVATHPHDIQIFKHEPVVGLDQIVRDLMEEVPTNVPHAVVVPRELCGSSLAAVGTRLLAGYGSCKSTLPPHTRRQWLGRAIDVGYFTPVRCCGYER